MNALASSQCSSGCESGWTLYLEQSLQLNHNAFSHASSQFDGEDNDEYKDKKAKKEEAEEEDLSMVSDASSGPPHLPDAQDNGSFYSASKAAKLGKRSKKRQKVKEYQHLPSFLDDTASSSVFDFSMNNVTVTNQQTSTESLLDYSQGFSATYYEERSSLQDQFGFLEPSLSENGVENNKQMLLLYTGQSS
ncbi:protein SOB FIVE-LIKE 5-like [Vigna umbellata]|uniref:protein SOB FIVE-LIKE 5-like n=1 Tax=Vigna umbellata TaxID=87088 RepID=UPI001F5F2932|nr:protein SOB FIVE-LIKE 5-like [Vigna umbellata]